MKAINTTVQQAVNQFTDIALLNAFVSGFTGEETADSELIIKSGQVVKVVKNCSEWPALITIRTDETPPTEEQFYDTECISIIFPDPDTAYFKNLAAELQQELAIVSSMHIDNDRYKWEALGCGSVDELIEHYLRANKELEQFKAVITQDVARFIGTGIRVSHCKDSINEGLAKHWVPVVGLLENLSTTKYPAGKCKHGVILYGNECLNCTRESTNKQGGAA